LKVEKIENTKSKGTEFGHLGDAFIQNSSNMGLKSRIYLGSYAAEERRA
jgi:hypothetical protein